jgi:hypothetical protein
MMLIRLLPITLCLLLVWPSLQAQTEWRRDSVSRDLGVPITSEFEPDSRYYITAYAENGEPAEIIFTRLNEFGTWENVRRLIREYEGENLSSQLVQNWIENDQEWVDRTVRLFNYNAQGQLSRRLVRTADMPGAPLENSARWGYSYFPDGNEEEILSQQWEDGAWKNRRRQRFTYTTQGEKETQTLELWNEANSNWEGSQRRLWSYTANGFNIDDLITQSWDMADNSWANVSRRQFFYNNAGFWQGTAFQDWNEEAGQWENRSRELYSLNAQNNMDNLLFQEWDGSGWQSRVRETTTMNGLSLSTVIEQQDTTSGEWERVNRYGTIFSSDGRVLEDIRNQVWEENAQEWLNDNNTIRYTHYWSAVVVSTEAKEVVTSFCRVPNPYQAGMPILCDTPRPNQPMDIRLFDMLGRQIHQATTQTPQHFTLNHFLPAGTYMLHLSQGPQILQTQLLIVSH